MLAPSTRVATARLSGGSQLHSKSCHFSSSWPSSGFSPSHPVGLPRWAVRRKLATFSVASVEKAAKMPAMRRLNFKISIILLNLNGRHLRTNHIMPCFLVSALAHSTLAVVSNSSSGSRSCRSGLALQVSPSMLLPSSALRALLIPMFNGLPV